MASSLRETQEAGFSISLRHFVRNICDGLRVQVSGSTLHLVALFDQKLAHAVAEVALDFHGIFADRAAGAADALELAAERLQEFCIAGEIVDDRDGLPAAARFFNPKLGDDLGRDRIAAFGSLTALAIVSRPTAFGTDAAFVS
jgi:hypothetical protein